MMQLSYQNSFGQAVFRGGHVGPSLCNNGSQGYPIHLHLKFPVSRFSSALQSIVKILLMKEAQENNYKHLTSSGHKSYPWFAMLNYTAYLLLQENRPFQMRAWSCITSYPLWGLPYLAYDSVNPMNSMMLRSSMLAFEKVYCGKIIHMLR